MSRKSRKHNQAFSLDENITRQKAWIGLCNKTLFIGLNWNLNFFKTSLISGGWASTKLFKRVDPCGLRSFYPSLATLRQSDHTSRTIELIRDLKKKLWCVGLFSLDSCFIFSVSVETTCINLWRIYFLYSEMKGEKIPWNRWKTVKEFLIF